MKAKPCVVYIVKNYPQLSQTYIKNEIGVLREDFDIRIIALDSPDYPDPDHYPFRRISEPEEIVAAVRELKPAVLHAHYLQIARIVAGVARDTGTPFTIRAHSFDTIVTGDRVKKHLRNVDRHINSELCLGVLCFPFAIPSLVALGVSPAKLIAAMPVVAFDTFYDRATNSGGAMNVGAGIKKKKMEDFIELAKRVPEMEFDLYPIGHASPELAEVNRREGGPIKVREPVPFADMPRVYKSHRWLVYTACPVMKTVGWPMALAEAQASGVAVCMANIRPDLRQYVGEAGYLYDSIDEVAELLKWPVPESMREAGFEQARRSDIRLNRSQLTDLWQPYLR
jgi:glycosyltransferase involved in cell wall biosynthesis